jgi:cytochrome oxidase assembly protein ShyY1
MNPTWFEIAKRPKYLLGLAVAILTAVVFSLLGQWQLSRTFETVGTSSNFTTPVPIQDLLLDFDTQTSGPVFDRLVTAEVQLDLSNLYIVGNRLQLRSNDTTEAGYWLVGNSSALIDEKTYSLTLALAFSADLAEIRAAKAELETSLQAQAFLPIQGLVEPTEAPKDSLASDVLGSLSLAQLVNLYSQEPILSLPAYVIVTDGFEIEGLEQIRLRIQSEQLSVNWLTAFYALEWAFFALAAFYVWWRVVMDEVLRRRNQQ